MFVLELDLDLPRFLPLAAAEEQTAVTRKPLYLCAAVIQELISLPVPLDLDGLMANEMQLEDGVVPHFDDYRLSEGTEVLRAKPWRI